MSQNDFLFNFFDILSIIITCNALSFHWNDFVPNLDMKAYLNSIEDHLIKCIIADT